jgi:hypothetical protein
MQSSLRANDDCFPILRVFVSWPSDPNLERSLLWKKTTMVQGRAKGKKSQKVKHRNTADKSDDEGEVDSDLHPLATLHMKNFNITIKKLDEHWFLGDLEQSIVFHSLYDADKGGPPRRSARLAALVSGANSARSQ